MRLGRKLLRILRIDDRIFDFDNLGPLLRIFQMPTRPTLLDDGWIIVNELSQRDRLRAARYQSRRLESTAFLGVRSIAMAEVCGLTGNSAVVGNDQSQQQRQNDEIPEQAADKRKADQCAEVDRRHEIAQTQRAESDH